MSYKEYASKEWVGEQIAPLLEGAGSGDSNVFIVEHGKTPYADIYAAYEQGKVLVLQHAGNKPNIPINVYYDSTKSFRAPFILEDKIVWYEIDDNENWTQKETPLLGIEDFPTTLPNPADLKITSPFGQEIYNGRNEVEITIPQKLMCGLMQTDGVWQIATLDGGSVLTPEVFEMLWANGVILEVFDVETGELYPFDGISVDTGVVIFARQDGTTRKEAALQADGTVTMTESEIAGGGKFRLIREVVIPEDITTDTSGVAFAEMTNGGITFAFDTDKDGNPFECTELYIGSYAATNHTTSSFNINITRTVPEYAVGANISSDLRIGVNGNKVYSTCHILLLHTDIANNRLYSVSSGAQFGGGAYNNVQTSAKVREASGDFSSNPNWESIDKIRMINVFMSNLAAYGFAPGSTFTFYGR